MMFTADAAAYYRDHGFPYVLGALAMMTAGIAQTLSKKNKENIWKKREEEAKIIYESLGNNSESSKAEFALYLRPFALDDSLKIKKIGSHFGLFSMSYYTGNKSVDFEEMLHQALEGRCPVIGIGETSHSIGMVTTLDDSWQKEFKRLAFNAKYIFVLPHDSDGVIWEVGWLNDAKMLDRVIFVLPSLKYFPDRSAIGKYWEKVQGRHAGLGTILPDFPQSHSEGTLVTYNQDGSQKNLVYFETSPFSLISKLCLRKAISNIVYMP